MKIKINLNNSNLQKIINNKNINENIKTNIII